MAAPADTPADATAIVLAGGRSSRFGGQKLAADLGGEPLLHHAIRAAAAACSEVMVVGTPDGVPVAMPDGLAITPVVVLDDDHYEGPLAALAHALASATNARVLVIGGDMPDLQPSILGRLLRWAPGLTGACLVVGGWTQPLPMGLDRTAAAICARELVDSGERSLRTLIANLVIEQVTEAEWRHLDPHAQSLRDIDRPDDLTPVGDQPERPRT